MTSKAVENNGEKTAVGAPLAGQVMAGPGLPSAATYDMPYRVADLFPEPSTWAEYPQVEIDKLIDRDILIQDCMVFESLTYDGKEWAIILYEELDVPGQMFTTALGGEVAMRKLKKMKEMRQPGTNAPIFPIPGRFTLTPSQVRGHQPYYNLI